MTQLDEKIEEFHPLIGHDLSEKFEQQVATALAELAQELQYNAVETDVKTNYVTHVFAQMLDELSIMVERPALMN